MEESDKIQFNIANLKDRLERIQDNSEKYQELEKLWHLELVQIKYDLYRLRLKLYDQLAKRGNNTT